MARTTPWSALALAAATLLPAPAGAQMPEARTPAARAGSGDLRRALQLRQQERPDDPPGVPALPSPLPPGGFVPRKETGYALRGPVQVNVDALGRNIVGDAGNEPSIAVDPTDPRRMAIGWRQFDTITSNFREAGWAYTMDAGQTWTFPGVLEDGVFRSDPVLAFDAQGDFYYNSLEVIGGGSQFACQVFKSSDGGMTWGPPVQAFGGDKAWMVVDRVSVVGGGNVYSAWSLFAGCCGSDTFIRSLDGAASFQTPVPLLLNPVFGTMAVGPSGAVYVAGANPNDFSSFLVAKSLNAWNPLSPPSFAFTTAVSLGGGLATSTGPNPAGLTGQVNVETDVSGGPFDGNVYLLCSVNPPGPDPLDVQFSRSVDGGLSWSAPVRVNDDVGNAWQWFGTMSVAPDGRIDVVWNDTRDSGATNLSRLYYAFSYDGGVTWSPSRALSDTFNSFLGWPNQNKLGDYYDMVSDVAGANLAWAATFNGEQDVYYLRIQP